MPAACPHQDDDRPVQTCKVCVAIVSSDGYLHCFIKLKMLLQSTVFKHVLLEQCRSRLMWNNKTQYMPVSSCVSCSIVYTQCIAADRPHSSLPEQLALAVQGPQLLKAGTLSNTSCKMHARPLAPLNRPSDACLKLHWQSLVCDWCLCIAHELRLYTQTVYRGHVLRLYTGCCFESSNTGLPL